MTETGGKELAPRVHTLGPLVAESFTFSVAGELHVGVVAKATFKLAPGPSTVSAPRPILAAEERQPSGTSTRWPSDLVPFRPRADVIFQGRAFAPPAGETREMLVRLTVQRVLAGSRNILVDRRVRVRGDAGPDGQSQPLREVPLVWEHALLAPDNPLGVERPNLVDPTDPTRAICLGPEHPTILRQRAGITSEDRRELSAQRPSLRADFPWDFFQSAPAPQRIPFLVGDEWLGLQGLHPFLPLLETRLPGVNAEARIYGLSGEGLPEGTELRLLADTLLIDGDALEASVVWRGHFGVADDSLIAPMRIMTGLALPGQPIAWPDRAPETLPLASQAAKPAKRKPGPAEPHALSQTIAMAPEAPRSLPFVSRPGAPISIEPADFPEPEEAAPMTVVMSQPGAAPSEHGAREAPVRLSEGAPRSIRFAAAPAPVEPAGQGGPTVMIREAQTVEDEPSPTGLATRSRVPVAVAPSASGARPPIVAFSFPWSLEPPSPVLVVVCKATYDLAPDGTLTPADEPDLPSGDVQEGDNLLSSVLVPSDFAPFKPRADVLLVGAAHAPGGRANQAEIRLRFGESLDRRAVVFGERRWEGTLSLSPSQPKPFETIPLRWERAFGGPDYAQNPVGRGALAAPQALLPNLEDPARLLQSTTDAPAPICFGPIPALWSERAALLGTYDSSWVAQRWPYFPADFDWGHFQSAPKAQQTAYPRGDEAFVLAGVHPRGTLEGRLPGVRARASARRANGELVEVVLRLDTVCFDTERMRVTLVWRGQLPTADDAASDLAEILVLEEPLAGPPSTPAEVQHAWSLAHLPPVPEEGEDGSVPLPETPDNDAPGPDPRAEAILERHAAKVRARLQQAGVLSTRETPARQAATPEAPPPEPMPVRPELRALVVDYIERDASLDSLDLQSSDLQGLSLRGRSLVGANLKDARLAGVDLSGAWLAGAVLIGADLRDAVLLGVDLRGADLSGAQLEGATLEDARVEGASFVGCGGQGACFERAEGADASFVDARLEGARFGGCDLPDADFSGARLEGARFEDAKLPNVRLYETRAAGASFDRAKLSGARANQANLERATLRGADLEGASLDDAILVSAVFLGAQAKACTFVAAAARGAMLSSCELSEARFQRCDLSGASLARSNLMKASFEGAVLTGADLRGCNLHGAEVWKASLAGVKLDGAITTQSKLARART